MFRFPNGVRPSLIELLALLRLLAPGPGGETLRIRLVIHPTPLSPSSHPSTRQSWRLDAGPACARPAGPGWTSYTLLHPDTSPLLLGTRAYDLLESAWISTSRPTPRRARP